MLLTITTTHKPATDLGYLLYKHPDKLQTVELSAGKAHIFYPEASEEKCTVALLLEIDPVELVRNSKGPAGEGFALEQYVNDRPYVASSFMSVAISKGFSTAMNGTCKTKPELVDQVMPFEVIISVLPSKGGELFLRKLFEPLGYKVQATRHVLDESFPEWGDSRYFTIKLSHELKLKDLLSHLYVLIPVLDNDKHYWVSEHEVQKLLEKGAKWLPNHPEKEQIAKRYLKNIGHFTKQALAILSKDNTSLQEVDSSEEEDEPKAVQRLHDFRLEKVLAELKSTGAKRVIDLGCGEGKLLKLLLKEKVFEEILGMDVSYKSLEIAKERLNIDDLPLRQKERIKLIQGSLMYRDKRLEGYDAAAIVEVIEHMDPARLAAFERVVFEYARPENIIITTPNAEYNQKFESLSTGTFRHADHRFEWSRKEFEAWASAVGKKYSYKVEFKPIGPDVDERLGAVTQMAKFVRTAD
jgi:3' terminal RNA ribose 2'-O-methyltransferase Hen1